MATAGSYDEINPTGRNQQLLVFRDTLWGLVKRRNAIVVSDSLALKTLTNERAGLGVNKAASVYVHLSSKHNDTSARVIDLLYNLDTTDLENLHTFRFFVGDDSTCSKDLVLDYNITTVPTVVLIYDGVEIMRYEGAEPVRIYKLLLGADEAITEYRSETHPAGSYLKPSLVRCLNSTGVEQLAAKLIQMSPFMLFLKGTKHRPMCKFSRRFVEIMNSVPCVEYKCWNVLEDNKIRDCLSKMSSTKIFPQLWFDGKFIGGVQELTDFAHDGTLQQLVQDHRRQTLSSVELRVYDRICQSPVVLIMTGTKEEPKDAKSKDLVNMLTLCDIDFDCLDISSEPEIALLSTLIFVKKGCWDSYDAAFPLVFANGAFIGDHGTIASTFRLNGAPGVQDLLHFWVSSKVSDQANEQP